VHTFWKLAAIAFVVLGVTAVTSTLTTAYLTRVPVSGPAPLAAAVAPAVRRAAMVEVARPRPLPARAVSTPERPAAPTPLAAEVPAPTPVGDTVVHEPVPVSPDPAVASTPTAPPRAESPAPEPAASTTAAPAPAAPRAPAPATTECDASGRTWKIAKPGLIGTAIGAGVGAAGGAIASGGKGAGQGAIIGGLAGAALGSGYGAYQTKNECGNVFGSDQKVRDQKASASTAKAPTADRTTPIIADRRTPAPDGAEAPFATQASDQITIYTAR
jgi:hypothetical protein